MHGIIYTNVISAAHIICAVFSSWRIVELFLMDRITEPLRKKFPSYIWQCSRCLSVWAGAACALMLAFAPWLNWPFALSWIYFVHNDWIMARRQAKSGRRAIVEVAPNGTWKLAHNELSAEELRNMAMQMIGANQQVNGAEKTQ